MKVIAFYLPQYHRIPENDRWWGEGFTEWTNLKKARPLFEGHYQPRVPLNGNYYNLLEDDVKVWQCKIAREHGIYGFCFYHYWFDGKMLLEKPMEQYLANPKCDLPFCICWANEHWTNAWVSKKDSVLIEQRYGERDQWVEHFNYFLPFFLDERYIKEDGKPLVVIYRPELIDVLNDMLDCWQEKAIENGLPGLVFAYQHVSYDNITDKDDSRFKYAIEYQPGYAQRDMDSDLFKSLKKIKGNINLFLEKHLKVTVDIHKLISSDQRLNITDYDAVWESLLKRVPPSEKYIPGAFVDWDNSPRRGDGGRIFVGGNPEKFESYFKRLIDRATRVYKKDYIFVFAWNEWTEGGYLEPDEKYGYGYLEAIKKALEEACSK
ncbi:MAG: glycoside hydrolase family 99-like domain-containing protein [Phascolarctobacterium sp.]|nr:glycoside hydrolase family 99-like domain-containing protein [Phascolarctobacterium sp.]